MKPLFYLIRKSIKNFLFGLKKKPLLLLLYVVLAGIMIFAIVVSLKMDTSQYGKGRAEVFGALASVIILAIFYLGIKQGLEKGASFFRSADINFLFTAPISPRKILVYGFLKQLSASFLLILFLLFQTPNLINNFPLAPYGILITFAGIFLLIFAMPLISMLVYSFTSVSKLAKQSVQRGLNLVLLALLALFLAVLFKTGDVLKAAFLILNHWIFTYVPVTGWFKGFLMAAVMGIDAHFYIYSFLVFSTILLLTYAIYQLKTDYYEDVLLATESKEEILQAKREGKSISWRNNTKLKKATQLYKHGGAQAIFYKHLLEYKKTGYFFVDRNTLFLIVLGISATFFFPKASINTVLFFSIYLLFFFSIQGKWAGELQKPFIYLIPAGSGKKVFFASLSQGFKNLMDGFLLFTVVGFMLKADVLTILCCILIYTAFGMIYIYGEILARRILGAAHSKHLKFFTKLLLIFLLVLPGIIGFTVLSFMNHSIWGDNILTTYIPYLFLLIYTSLISFLILLFSRGIFEKLEVE